MIATSRGVSTSPPASSPSDTARAIANDSAKPSSGDPQHLPAQLLELDLQARQEEHEREPEQRDHLDRLVHLDDPEHRRAGDDPGEDLEHHGWQLHTREEAEQHRCGEGDRHDHEEVGEGEQEPPFTRRE